MKDYLQEHTFYNMMKQNTCFKCDGDLCIYLLITNSNSSVMKTNLFETGLSDHHHMIYTILKTKFEKFEPKKLIYRNFNQFDSDQFKLDICNSMSDVTAHAAFKKHVSKKLRKQIMVRSRLKNKANKSKNPIYILRFKQQRKLVANLNKQAKLQYLEKVSVNFNSKPKC